MADSGFWKVRQAECERYAEQFPELRAVWNAYHGSWNLWWGLTPDGLQQVPAEAEAALNDLSQKCAPQLPNARVAFEVTNRSTKEQLLDYLREFMRERKWYYDPIAIDDRAGRKWGFRITHHHPISELVWDAGVRIGKPPVQVRKDLNLSTGEEESDYRWLESGNFDHIFEALAVLFADLAGRAFESEAQRIAVADGLQSSSASNSNPKEPASTAVHVIQKAMRDSGLNPATLATKIRPILRREKSRLKADRSTLYRIAEGITKNPGPALVKALIEALQLKLDEAAVLHRDFRKRVD
jgi:hypothetical protein